MSEYDHVAELFALAVATQSAVAGMQAHNTIAEQNGTGLYDEQAFIQAAQPLHDALANIPASKPTHPGADVPIPRYQIEQDVGWLGGERHRLLVDIGNMEIDLLSTSRASEAKFAHDALVAYAHALRAEGEVKS